MFDVLLMLATTMTPACSAERVACDNVLRYQPQARAEVRLDGGMLRDPLQRSLVGSSPSKQSSEVNAAVKELAERLTPSVRLNEISDDLSMRSDPTLSLKVRRAENRGFEASVQLTFSL